MAAPAPIPGLDQIPFLGPVLFNHPLPVYLSVVLIGICCWYLYRTSPGLKLRAVGENPQAAYARGINPQKVQVFYAVCGGLLVGLSGATFSLCTKPGWGRPQGAEGTGWIALALVIFVGSRGFANEHELRVDVAHAKNHVASRRHQVRASHACQHLLTQRGHGLRFGFRIQWRGF